LESTVKAIIVPEEIRTGKYLQENISDFFSPIAGVLIDLQTMQNTLCIKREILTYDTRIGEFHFEQYETHLENRY
jgi:hypothetical protein